MRCTKLWTSRREEAEEEEVVEKVEEEEEEEEEEVDKEEEEEEEKGDLQLVLLCPSVISSSHQYHSSHTRPGNREQHTLSVALEDRV